eukprot:UN19195
MLGTNIVKESPSVPNYFSIFALKNHSSFVGRKILSEKSRSDSVRNFPDFYNAEIKIYPHARR